MALDLTLQITADASQAKAELRSVEQSIQKVESANKSSVNWWQKEEQAIDKVTGTLGSHRGELSKVEQGMAKMATATASAATTSEKLGSVSASTTTALSGMGGGAEGVAAGLLEMVGAGGLSVGMLTALSAGVAVVAAGLIGFLGLIASSVDYYIEHAKAAKGLRDEIGHLSDAWDTFRLLIGAAVMDGENAPLVALFRLATNWATQFGLQIAGDILFVKELLKEIPGMELMRGLATWGDPGASPSNAGWTARMKNPNGDINLPGDVDLTHRNYIDYALSGEELSQMAIAAEKERQRVVEASARLAAAGMRAAEHEINDVARQIESLHNHAFGNTGTTTGFGLDPSTIYNPGAFFSNLTPRNDVLGPIGLDPSKIDLGGIGHTGFFGSIQNAPGFFRGAFGSSQQFGGDLSRTILGAIMGGGNVGGATGGFIGQGIFGNLAKTLTSGAGKAFDGLFGGALNAVLPGVGGILGSLVGKLFGGLFGETQGHKDLMAGNKQIADMKEQLLGVYGSMQNLQAAGKMFGLDWQSAWGSQNLQGAEAFKKMLDEMAKKQAQFNSDLGGTLGKIKDLGGNVPEALLPYLQQLKDAKVLTQDNLDLIAALSGQNTVDFGKMEEAANRYGISIDALGQTFKEHKMHEGWQQIIDDLDLLQRGGADMNAVLGAEGMQKKINELVQQSIHFGTTIPENFKPFIQTLIESGRLIGEDGKAITDLNGLHFGETMQTTLDNLNQTLKDLIDALGVKLPGAAKLGAEAWRREFSDLPLPGGAGPGGKTGAGSPVAGGGAALHVTFQNSVIASDNAREELVQQIGRVVVGHFGAQTRFSALR